VVFSCCSCYLFAAVDDNRENMRQRTRPVVLLLFSLGLIAPQSANIVLPGARSCTGQDGSCRISAALFGASDAFPAIAGHGIRIVIDAGRHLDGGRLNQLTLDRLTAVFVGRNQSGLAQASASTREHQAGPARMRAAASGFRASPPRAPPAHI
jgi:hypothetical protein